MRINGLKTSLLKGRGRGGRPCDTDTENEPSVRQLALSYYFSDCGRRHILKQVPGNTLQREQIILNSVLNSREILKRGAQKVQG